MKIFIDSANLHDIEDALKRGFVRGITTNPSLLSKEPKTQFSAHIGKIIELIRRFGNGIHLSVEVFSQNPEEILRQANEFRETFRYEHLSIKVQIGWDELEAIRKLAADGFSVNCTCCMTVSQAAMAAAAGARYVSLFWGRIRDSANPGHAVTHAAAIEKGALDEKDASPHEVVRAVRMLLDRSYPNVEIIAGSIRKVTDVRDAALAGAHIVTVPPKFFPDMISHFKTDEVIAQFLSDFKNWMS